MSVPYLVFQNYVKSRVLTKCDNWNLNNFFYTCEVWPVDIAQLVGHLASIFEARGLIPNSV